MFEAKDTENTEYFVTFKKSTKSILDKINAMKSIYKEAPTNIESNALDQWHSLGHFDMNKLE